MSGSTMPADRDDSETSSEHTSAWPAAGDALGDAAGEAASTPATAPVEDSEELLRRARRGDGAAVEALYREHVGPATALARVLAGPAAADDLVADAFARVLAQIRAGRGPGNNFRAYLFATIRNRHRDILRRTNRETPVPAEDWLLEMPDEVPRDGDTEVDDDAAVAALTSLPHRWQQVLWHLEVEERSVPEVAALLDLSPAAVSSLAYRAREGLRLAYLTHHLPATTGGTSSCEWTRPRLAGFVRGGLTTRAAVKVDSHLAGCRACALSLVELKQVNADLAAWWLPVLLLGGVGAHLGDGPAAVLVTNRLVHDLPVLAAIPDAAADLTSHAHAVHAAHAVFAALSHGLPAAMLGGGLVTALVVAAVAIATGRQEADPVRVASVPRPS
ncbi:sigma-70 family RNA polymerase sigma factor [Nocardioides sp. zg-ZUI104]|uniref:sigma-70 family RNA polymerase sigma factor n=1 Tax=Nocardioides faecalis TaxID=2803858 RepID=UPI001BCEA9D8|nr:sigma-70 family RNA polymerase sigma factor [Nocardioides faecalis]MBS4753703.1 sigma-70 family RNA polymerase sigma factor [Nocardioides faecalis]